jgi:integrase
MLALSGASETGLLSGQSRSAAASVKAMRYSEIREHLRAHFTEKLRRFEDWVDENGPPDAERREKIKDAAALAEMDWQDWSDLIGHEEASKEVTAFCAARGLASDALPPKALGWVQDGLRSGLGWYWQKAIEHVEGLDRFDAPTIASTPQPGGAAKPDVQEAVEAISYQEVVDQHFLEIQRSGGLAPKTYSQKREVLDLLGEITEGKPVAELTKADSRHVKDVLLRYPQNRRKKAATKGKALSEVLDISGVDCISPSTANTYLSHMQTFMRWAVDNGHASANPFDGMRVKVRKSKADKRDPFSADQLQRLFEHLTENPMLLVNTDANKWGSLIGMFTGMRLNEIAQLEVSDIKQVDGLWCIDVTDVGDGATKRLKTSAADRRVPLHDRLIGAGFLDFVERQKEAGHARLFPKLSYCPKNGYGRAVSRWFNDTLLKKLGMKTRRIVFHSLRHSMNTRLYQADVPEPQVKAIIGHEQQGVSTGTYFKEGYRLAQLKAAIEKFDF